MDWFESKTAIDGQQVYFQQWQPDIAPIARVLLIHGVGEHSGRYAHVGDFFANAGIALTGFDLLGHGKTDGQRGHADSYEVFCRQIDHFLPDLFSAQPAAPVFLYGHSMGGLIAMYYTLQRKPEKIIGVISTSPGLKPGYPIPAWKTTVGNLLYSILPRFSMDNGLPLDGISHDKAVVEAYKADKLNHPLISARMGMDLIRNGELVSAKAADFSLPLLLMVGGDDQLVSPDAVKEFGANSGNKTTLKVWEGGYHELHNEPFKREVLQIMVDWIKTNAAT